MRYWRNWRCTDEPGGTGNGATRPPLESGNVGYSEPEALVDKYWGRPLNDGYTPGFSEPADDLPSKNFNYWRFIKWFRYGLPDFNANPSTPGMAIPTPFSQAEEAKRFYTAPSTPIFAGGPSLMEDWGGLVLVMGYGFGNDRMSISKPLEIFQAQVFAFSEGGGLLTYEVRVKSPTPNNYGDKTLKCIVDGGNYTLDVGFVGTDWKTLETFHGATTFTFVEQSTP